MITVTYALTVGAVFILQRTQPDRPRPYRCAGYSWLPAVYIVVAIAFVISTPLSRPTESIIGLGMACLGIPRCLYRQRRPTATNAGSMLQKESRVPRNRAFGGIVFASLPLAATRSANLRLARDLLYLKFNSQLSINKNCSGMNHAK